MPNFVSSVAFHIFFWTGLTLALGPIALATLISAEVLPKGPYELNDAPWYSEMTSFVKRTKLRAPKFEDFGWGVLMLYAFLLTMGTTALYGAYQIARGV